jgi:hypothetical protein
MFNGDDSVRIRTKLSEEQIEEIVENALDRIGRVRFGKRGSFEVSGRRFENSFATAEIYGRLAPGRKDGEWRLSVRYEVKPSALCWVIAILGAVFSLLGVLILLAPQSTKNDVEKAVRRALRDARDDVEEQDESARPTA